MAQTDNHFELLGLPPKAALDEASLQTAYLQAAKKFHPDCGQGDADQSAALNTALAVLGSPAQRLKHLLELHNVKSWRPVTLDADMMDLFSRLSSVLGKADELAAKTQASSSSLAKALMAPRVLEVREGLEQLASELMSARQKLEDALPLLDDQILAGEEKAWEELQASQARLAYLEKWHSQARQRLMLLML